MSPPADVPDAAGAAGPTAGIEPVAARLGAVRGRIAAATERAGRAPTAVTLVAVGKAFGPEMIEAARAAGQTDFGESRAQELKQKVEALGPGIRWHFVGRLQRNKVRDVVGVVTLVHSVDRLELAEALAERARALGKLQRVLVQVNAGDDPDKAGCAPEETGTLVAKIRGLDWIACEGLMTIPPLEADPRPVFTTLRELRDDIRDRFPEVQHLSMGMTHDFETAIEEGATIVRIGEAIFGPRETAD